MKKNLAAIVTVRSSSKRLDQKCFMKISNSLTLLEVIIRRAKKIGCQVIVATSDVKTDDAIVSLAKKENVFYFRGSLPNKINRWFRCFQQYNLDAAMLVDADDPSFSYSVLSRALCQLNKEKTDLIKCDDTMMPGLITYGISKNGIQKLYNEAKEKELDTDVIEVFIDKANLKTSVIKPNDGEELVPKIRLTIDYKEDITFYQALFREISYEAESTEHIKKIIELEISKINWFRNSNFKQNQNKFNKKIRGE